MLALIICQFHEEENVIKELNIAWGGKTEQLKLQSSREGQHKTTNTLFNNGRHFIIFFKSSLNISTLGRNQMQNICIFKLAYI